MTAPNRFPTCLPIILQSEGGFSDHPSDPGGATMDGITLDTFGAFLRRAASVAELQHISDDAVTAIYMRQFWWPSHAGDCPPGVDLMVFDAAVNSGPHRSVV
jgi:lysozyme family protein